jgi:dolichol-phosphate mannosyltransferase
MMPPDLSIVIPCYAEEATLQELHRRLTAVLVAQGIDYELIFVDDGSPDETRASLRALRLADPRLRWIGLTRNFGHQAALTAGLGAARGRHVLTMDADLQHPPERIPDLLEKAREGNDVVVACRSTAASQSLLKRATSRAFYALLNRVGRVRVEPGSSDFRLLSRRALVALLAMPERRRFLRGMVAWIGFPTAVVHYDAARRAGGERAYTVRRMAGLAADALFSFSTLPQRAAAVLGLLVTLASGLYGIYALWVRLWLRQAVPGWTSLLVSVLFLGGVQLLTLGIVGEYVSRVYDEVKRRPLYVVEERDGFDESA